jgi:hypothetical protein
VLLAGCLKQALQAAARLGRCPSAAATALTHMVQAQIICTKSFSRGSVVERPAASRTIAKKISTEEIFGRRRGRGIVFSDLQATASRHRVDPNARPEFKS